MNATESLKLLYQKVLNCTVYLYFNIQNPSWYSVFPKHLQPSKIFAEKFVISVWMEENGILHEFMSQEKRLDVLTLSEKSIGNPNKDHHEVHGVSVQSQSLVSRGPCNK